MMVDTKQHETRERPEKSGPERTCAGCGKHAPADDLVRVVLDPSSGEIAIDLADKKAGLAGFGRGAHVHPSPACVAKAIKSGFSRSFKTKVVVSPEAFGAELVRAADRRIEGLVAGARRGKLVVMGADAVREAAREGKAELIIVARDAAAAAKLREVEEAVANGKAIAWSEKVRLGALFGRDEVAVCALVHPGLAAAVMGVYRASRPFVGSEAWWSPEVR